MLQHFPSGTSGRNIVHTAQNIKQDKFQAYDWGIRFFCHLFFLKALKHFLEETWTNITVQCHPRLILAGKYIN